MYHMFPDTGRPPHPQATGNLPTTIGKGSRVLAYLAVLDLRSDVFHVLDPVLDLRSDVIGPELEMRSDVIFCELANSDAMLPCSGIVFVSNAMLPCSGIVCVLTTKPTARDRLLGGHVPAARRPTGRGRCWAGMSLLQEGPLEEVVAGRA